MLSRCMAVVVFGLPLFFVILLPGYFFVQNQTAGRQPHTR